MAVGWAQFFRERAVATPPDPDSVVAPPRTWLIRAALLASGLVLLGTSETVAERPPDSVNPGTTYEFERSVTGEAVELTAEHPRALFLVTLRATALGPYGAITTDVASVDVTGSITSSDTEVATPGVTIDLSGDRRVVVARGDFASTKALEFAGTCEAPAEDAPCQATFTVEFSRNDDGEQGGSIFIDWAFLLQSQGFVAEPKTEQGKQDPPWSVEVEAP